MRGTPTRWLFAAELLDGPPTPAAEEPWLLKRSDRGAGELTRAGRAPATVERRPRIRCPRCGWEPRKQDRWSCGCGCIWNTFDTGGVCPACGQKWRDTQCLRCIEWSRHDDWYVWDDDPPEQA